MRFSSSEVADATYKVSGDLYPLKYICLVYLAIIPLKMFAADLGEGTHAFAKIKQKLKINE